MTEQHFVLKPNGKIYWIQEPVKVPAFASSTRGIGRYNEALQYAIDNAVEVSNQKEVTRILYNKYSDDGQDPEFQFKIGEVLSLQCSVEKKSERRYKTDCGWSIWYNNEPPMKSSGSDFQFRTTALVTFSQPEREETQEELIRTIIDMALNRGFRAYELAQHFTITRKTP